MQTYRSVGLNYLAIIVNLSYKQLDKESQMSPEG